jgi:hypothetical protein
MSIELAINDSDSSNCKFVFSNVNHTIVNAVRRALISKIKTFAFDNIVINKNSSNLDGDMLSHRISLIPVEKKCIISYNNKNTTNEIINVYSSDFTTDSWVYPNILLTILKPGQELDFTSTSSEGNGELNSKWSCVTDLCFYQREEIFFNNKLLEKDTLVDVSDLNIENLKNRLPLLFEGNSIIANRILIDHNLFNVINELIGSEIIVLNELPIYNMSFKTINNFTGITALLSAIKELYNECRNINFEIMNDTSIKIHHDYSLVYMIVEQYRKYFQHNISGIKAHPLDEFMVIKFNSPTFHQDLKLCLVYLEQELHGLLVQLEQ